jgi:hypothetical protein
MSKANEDDFHSGASFALQCHIVAKRNTVVISNSITGYVSHRALTWINWAVVLAVPRTLFALGAVRMLILLSVPGIQGPEILDLRI